MPDIAIAASPVTAASPAPAAAGKSSARSNDGQTAGPFAAVLQQQMENPAAAQASAIKTAAIATTAIDPVTDGDLAALLPMLMGSAMLAGVAPPDAEAPTAGPKISDEGDTSVTGTPVLLALPTTSMEPSAAVAATPATGTAGTASPAATTANLAAAPDLAATVTTPTTKGSDSFEALLADSRATNVPMAAMHTSPASNAAAAASSRSIETPVGSHGWDAEVGNHMVWMTSNQASRAELVLTPPQLGRIEISMTMSGDQATATFVSASPAVRDAIENAIPRLREILADAGVTLGQTQVGSEAPGQSANDSQNRDNPSRGSAIAPVGGLSLTTSASSASWTGAGRGLVDVFA
jgi:flagellar hook-length control protein FliK